MHIFEYDILCRSFQSELLIIRIHGTLVHHIDFLHQTMDGHRKSYHRIRTMSYQEARNQKLL